MLSVAENSGKNEEYDVNVFNYWFNLLITDSHLILLKGTYKKDLNSPTSLFGKEKFGNKKIKNKKRKTARLLACHVVNAFERNNYCSRGNESGQSANETNYHAA